MVQKKITITSKLGAQVDHYKIEKRLSNLKPSFSTQHHQDGKNRGPKKTKKYKSVELSDVENLRSSSMEKNNNISKPGKTPSTPPQKQPVIVIKSACGLSSPNYMKATSSSDGKIQHKRNNLASDGGTVSKPVKNILSRTSSLKKTMMRSLKKTPSFKTVNRGLSKKCSSTRVAICADVDMIQKSTCSSTLKDSKFPSFVMLNPGGTEAEGTSVEKVCPYSYCSLNGHHHAVSPPLKSFLSARRRSLKTLRSSKPERKEGKPSSGREIIDVDRKQLVFDEEEIKLTCVEDDGMDFRIEVYATGIENQKNTSNDYTTRENGVMNHDAESMSDDLSRSEIDFDGSFECCDDDMSSAMELDGVEEEKPRVSSEGEPSATLMGGFGEDCRTGLEDDEFTYMEWEEGKVFDLENDIEADGLVKSTDKESESMVECFVESSCEEFVNECSDEVLVDQVSQDIFEDESLCYMSSDSETEIETTEIAVVDMATPEVVSDQETETVALEMEGKEASIHAAADDQANTLSETEIETTEIVIVDTPTHEVVSDQETETVPLEMDGKEASIHAAADEKTNTDSETIFFRPRRRSNQDPPPPQSTCNNRKWSIGSRTLMEDNEVSKDFNPREPNYLPVVPDPDAEKVDLKHQEIDGRKNTEEWMLDYALQQAVTKLGQARKRKVSLLIEAFETVAPIPKWGAHVRHSSINFAHGRPVQACS